jgi:multisubunit Na+/H+ antiporter MnhG subunit
VSVGDVASGVLLALGTLALVIGGIGSALPRSPFVRLHYLNLATMLGAPLVVMGVVVRDPVDWFKLIVILVLLVATSPAASAATARALTRSEAGHREPAS